MMSDKIAVGIVEDEFIIAQDLRKILENSGYNISFTAQTVAEARTLLANTVVDILLIDIRLQGEGDGVDLAHYVRNNYQVPFIYITANSDPFTLSKVKETHPYGYILKPFDTADVYAAIEIALENFKKEYPRQPATNNRQFVPVDSFFLRDKNMMRRVKFEDIQYFQADGNHSIVFLQNRKYVLRKTLKDIEETIPAEQFIRIHKSFIVRASLITALEIDHVHLGQIKLPIGRSYQTLFSNITRLNR